MIYSRHLTRFSILVFFTNLNLIKCQVRHLALCLLFSVIDGFGWFWMGNLRKNMNLMLEFRKAPFLVLHFLLYNNDLSDDLICNIAIYADDTTLYSKCDQASDMGQQIELASELESDL